MNWHGFPVGFRFAAEEIDNPFKKQCWETVLTAASYADTEGMALQEAELEDPYSETRVYIPIIVSSNVGRMQKNAFKWNRDTALCGQLMLYRPFVQENYLEHNAVSLRKIGTILPGGCIQKEEDVSYLPEKIRIGQWSTKTGRAVFLSRIQENENRNGAISGAMQKLAEHGTALAVRPVNYTEGPRALYYAAASLNALLYQYSRKNEAGEILKIPYAVLPGGRCLLDGRAYADSEEKREAFTECVRAVTGWYGKGADVLARPENAFTLPENSAGLTCVAEFYRLKQTCLGTNAVFCAGRDSRFFEELTGLKPIEV